MALPQITFQEVSFGFGSEQVLNRFSFHAPAGTHTILRGESGSGKSTILQLILGFVQPQSGQIMVNRSPLSAREIRKQTGWLPQDLNLGTGSVQKVIDQLFQFQANASGKPTRKHQLEVLQKLGLDPIPMDKQFRDLSTGQRQRVGLAICHLLNKPLLLLDEPTSSLDRTSKQKAATLLLNNNCTVISTSHDPFWVNLADNVIDIDLWKS